MPMRRERKVTWKNILSFFGLVAVLFIISFAIAWNLIGAELKPSTDAMKELQRVQQELSDTISEKNELLAELQALRAQMNNSNVVPSATTNSPSPSVSTSPKPSTVPSMTATPKPSPKPSAATPTPSTAATPKPSTVTQSTD